jgi:hypothetical protein
MDHTSLCLLNDDCSNTFNLSGQVIRDCEMTVNHLFRRLHLYLALTLLPWVLMYGISAIPMTRPELSEGLYNHNPTLWATRLEKPYDRVVPSNMSRSDLQAFGQLILEDVGIERTSRSGAYQLRKDRITAYTLDFWTYTRVIYETDNQMIRVEDKHFRWSHLLKGLHERGGFGHGGFLNDLWAVVVDCVALGFVLWSVSGLYMWWQLKRIRKWGGLALGSGVVCFVGFLFFL